MQRTLSTVLTQSLTILAMAQGIPTSLRPDITVEHYMDVRSSAVRVAHDPVQQHLHYLRTNGDVLMVIDNGIDPPYDTLLFTSADHLLTDAYGMAFHDSDLFVIGNRIFPDEQLTQGIVHRARLQPDGTRTWSVVARTENYRWGGKAHGFNNVVVSPDGEYLLLNSGSRTDHGEVQSVGGLFPDAREDAITAKILRIPIDAQDLILPNDESALIASGQLFSSGVRNTFDMAFAADGELFGVENSGDHDDPEEMNWLRDGHHYGFPWQAGGNTNPTLLAGYDAANDPLLNPGYPSAATDFYFDPAFPTSTGLVFTGPMRNMGPDADRLRDPATGGILDASESGQPMHSFTCHRSPLGLVFDRDSMLADDLRGDGFVLSFTPGGDTAGYSAIAPWGIPVVPADPSEDLLHIELSYDQGTDDYTFTATRVVEGFYLPVDAELVGNALYVIENWGGTQRSLWRVIMPLYNTIAEPSMTPPRLAVWPVPAHDVVKWSTGTRVPAELEVLDPAGRVISRLEPRTSSGMIDLAGMPAGIYLLRSTSVQGISVTPLILAR